MMIGILLALQLTCYPVDQELNTNNFHETINCFKGNKQVAVVSSWTPLIQNHFKEEDQRRALRIIYCESTGRSDAVGVNKDGSKDIGLWQFNDHTWDWLKNKLNITSPRTDPIISTKVAKWLVYNDGWYHWNSSKHCWGD